MAVRALVFDVFGTLVDWRSGIAEAFRASGVAGDPDELANDWRARGTAQSWTRSMTARGRGATSTSSIS